MSTFRDLFRKMPCGYQVKISDNRWILIYPSDHDRHMRNVTSYPPLASRSIEPASLPSKNETAIQIDAQCGCSLNDDSDEEERTIVIVDESPSDEATLSKDPAVFIAYATPFAGDALVVHDSYR